MAGVPRSGKDIGRAEHLGNRIVTSSDTTHIDIWHHVVPERVANGEAEAVHLPSGQHAEFSINYRTQGGFVFTVHLGMDISSLQVCFSLFSRGISGYLIYCTMDFVRG